MKPDPNWNLFEEGKGSTAYAPIYSGLAELREEFHRSGRLDDSNAKLDEVVKLFATYLAARLGDVDDFPKPESSPESDFVSRLRRCFSNASKLPYYIRNDGISVFGSAPSLVLRDSDSSLAVRLTRLVVRAVDDAFRHQELGSPHDVLNEAFGHFVRDNFRGNIEDAQYLTPAEVVDLMTSVAMDDLKRMGRLSKKDDLVVADSCCGVGSFLTAFAAKYRALKTENAPLLKLYAQDKVERMVRLTTVNLTLFRLFDHQVSIGNSIYKGSPLDELNGRVDLILTNPPFGARFAQADIALAAGENTPFFSLLGRTRAPVESELLFVDRNLSLLREGGLLLIVVPDNVISASGPAALLRHHLRNRVTLRGVIELPSVTFAQAGTRTKTAILYLQKGRAEVSDRNHVFMGVSVDLGFQVNSRKGVQIKVEKGENDLPKLLSAYSEMHDRARTEEAMILSDAPSAAAIAESSLRDAWTASHYQARQLDVLHSAGDSRDVLTAQLKDLVDFVGDERRQAQYRPGIVFISVLHILTEGVLDLMAMRTYAPKTPGVPVKIGEVLLSRINPRIPRVLVVPDLGQPVLCSSEFEVMRPKKGLNPYMIAFLLLSQHVQAQIQSLTSGTSASHNRVKTRNLAEVSIPIPRKGSQASVNLQKKFTEYQKTLERLMESSQSLIQLRDTEMSWLNTRAKRRGSGS